MNKFQPVLELLRNKSVTELQNAFGECYESDKGINFSSFHDLLKTRLSLNVRENDVKHLFCQIDRYCKEIVTSEDLLNYLGEYEKKRTLPNEGPFEQTPTMYQGVRSQDSIIEWILYPEVPDVRNEVAEHYIYLSRSGILSVWTKDMKKRFETTIETIDDGATGKTTTWATSLACLPNEKMLAVATTSGDIRFFRSSTYKFEHKFSIVGVPYIVVRLNCFASQRLVCGDFSGSVFIIHMEKAFFTRNRRRASHLPPERIPFEYLQLGKVTGLSFEGTTKLYFSPVQMVEYIPSLGAVISCSVSTKRAMLIHFLEKNDSLSFSSLGGINCFAFCQRLNGVATGCVDQSIKIWNPTVNSSYNESLTGHTSPINHVLVDEKRLFLISSDREKIVRVWDLLHPKCLQVIKFKESEFPGKHSFASVFFDSANGKLILTTYRIGKLQFHQPEPRKKIHPCSEYLRLTAYSSTFDSIITVGDSSAVALWDVKSGFLIYEFDKTHEILDSDGFPQNMMVLTAGLDPSGRRLVTADRIGNIKVWNFHLGLCLQSFKANFRILSLSFVGYHIYASGSAGVIMDFYDNGYDTVESTAWEKKHVKSIVSVDDYRRYLIASASCDGEIVIWIRKSTDPKFHLKDLKEEAGQEEEKSYQTEIRKRRLCSISQILFLQKREMDFFVGNLVSCGMDGIIRFWNIVCTHKVNVGKLLTKFRPGFRSCDGVLCLTTDEDNHYLVSGDTMGYVKVYELDNYYSVYGSAPPSSRKMTSEQLSKFPFLRMQQLVKKKHSSLSKFPEDGGAELGHAPIVLNCFRAHLGAIIKVNYVNGKDLLITAGRDGSVRLWSVTGIYVGQLGPFDQPWNLYMAENRLNHMPGDIKTVASTLTLFVLNNGSTPHWARALELLKQCRLGHQPEEFTDKPLSRKLKKSLSLEDLPDDGNLEEELEKRLPYFRGTRV